MIIDAETLNQFFGALTVLILFLIAWYNQQRTASAAITAAATTQTAVTNQAMAIAPVVAPAPAIGYIPVDTRARDANGNLTTNQLNGSEYWLDAGYKGAEPTDAEKRAYTTTLNAYDNAVAQANALIGKYGADKVSAPIKAITTVTLK